MLEILAQINELLESLQVLAKTHIHWAPFIIFGLLMLAGLNLPISEDLVIFITAMVALQNPMWTPWLYLALFTGAVTSDLTAYWTGRLLGPKLFYFPMFKRLVTKEKLHRMARFYNRYGIRVLIVGRFIPFGVRNLMFITAGLGKSNFFKFLMADLAAAFISTGTYFFLFYTYGEAMLSFIQRFNVVLFSAFIVFASVYLYRRKQRKKHMPAGKTQHSIDELRKLEESLKKRD